MSRYVYTDRMEEISGFGGGFEDVCRKMVVAGLEWVDAHPGAKIEFSEINGVTGLTTDETPDCKEMQTAMNQAADNDASGAMIHVCSKHVLFVLSKGWEQYVKVMSSKK